MRPSRLTAIGGALLIHAVILVVAVNAPNAIFITSADPIDIALIFETPVLEESDSAELAALVEEPTPEFEPPPLEAEAPTQPQPESLVSTPEAEPPVEVSAQSTARLAVDSEFSDDVYVLSPGTQSVLRGLQCPGDPDAFAATGICPQSAGRHTAFVAADESASDFYAIDIGAIRALFGQAPHALSGQDTLDNSTQRRALSNADSMREALPASRPDPAFGD